MLSIKRGVSPIFIRFRGASVHFFALRAASSRSRSITRHSLLLTRSATLVKPKRSMACKGRQALILNRELIVHDSFLKRSAGGA